MPHRLPSVPDVPRQRRVADRGDLIELTSVLERTREIGLRRVGSGGRCPERRRLGLYTQQSVTWMSSSAGVSSSVDAF